MSSSGSPTVSVLLPYRDAGETIEEALASVLQDRDLPLEVIAVDDGSKDEGPQIVAARAREDARIVPIATGGVGIARALARAHEASRAPLLARMDADDISLPGRFAAQLDMLRRNASLGAVGTQVEAFPKEAVREGLALYIDWLNRTITPEDHAREIFVESPLCHPSAMMRREAYEAVGGFRDVVWAEDYDLWLRLHAAGYGLAKVPEILFRWRHHPGRATFRDSRYSITRFLEAKAHYLAPKLAKDGRDVVVWGAGPTGKRLARALAAEGKRPSRFIDIDPRKIGRTAQKAPITAANTLDPERDFVIVAVGARGAREEIRANLQALKFVETLDFICAS